MITIQKMTKETGKRAESSLAERISDLMTGCDLQTLARIGELLFGDEDQDVIIVRKYDEMRINGEIV